MSSDFATYMLRNHAPVIMLAGISFSFTPVSVTVSNSSPLSCPPGRGCNRCRHNQNNSSGLDVLRSTEVPPPLGLSPNARMRSPSQIGPSPWGESRVLLVSSQEWSLQLSNWNFRPSSSHAKPLFFTPTFVITKRNVHHAVTITKRGMCCIRSLGM